MRAIVFGHDSCGHSLPAGVDTRDDPGVGIGEHDRGAVGDHDRQSDAAEVRHLRIGFDGSLPQFGLGGDAVHRGAMDLGDEGQTFAAQTQDLGQSGAVGCDEFVIIADLAGEVERGEVPARVPAVPVGEGDVGGAPAGDDEPRAQHVT
jgi:hypothetical protein